jgi:hypothetical protein
MSVGRSLSRAFDNYARQDAEIRAANTQRAAEEAAAQQAKNAALESRRAELAEAGTPFITTDKFGDLVFEKDSFYTDYKIDGQVVGKDFVFYDPIMSTGAKAANQVVRYTGGVQPEYRYTFVPENIIEKGFKTDDKQYYLGNILAGDNLDALSQKGVYVDLAGVKDFDKQFKDQGLSTKGFLIPYAETEQRDLFSNIKNYDIGKASEDNTIKWGEIKGLSKSGDQYVYATDATPIGGVDQATGYINVEGLQGNWYKKPSGGGFLGDLGRAIADVPFGAELLGLATMNPYVYAAASGLRGGGTGQDPLKVGLQTGLTVGIASALGGAGGEPTGGVDYSLTGGGADVGGLGFQVPGGEFTGINLAPDVVSEGLKLSAGSLAPNIGTSIVPINLGLGQQDYSLLGGTSPEQLAGMGETGLLSGTGGEGLQLPQVPALPSMGGGQGLSVPVSGGTVTEAGFTPIGATPSLGDPGSFINDPNVLGQPVIQDVPGSILPNISITDALRGANLANQLMGGGQQTATGFPQQQSSFQPTGVDYSGIYGLLGQRASVPGIQGLLGPAQLRYPSLLR